MTVKRIETRKCTTAWSACHYYYVIVRKSPIYITKLIFMERREPSSQGPDVEFMGLFPPNSTDLAEQNPSQLEIVNYFSQPVFDLCFSMKAMSSGDSNIRQGSCREEGNCGMPNRAG